MFLLQTAVFMIWGRLSQVFLFFFIHIKHYTKTRFCPHLLRNERVGGSDFDPVGVGGASSARRCTDGKLELCVL